ncbi:hypothetical protein DFH09DRAFT_1086920 [Mycena vulgaris]|nr:hypothetical protein DFH09DRAFT_1086920 [Mycena vulgaris]
MFQAKPRIEAPPPLRQSKTPTKKAQRQKPSLSHPRCARTGRFPNQDRSRESGAGLEPRRRPAVLDVRAHAMTFLLPEHDSASDDEGSTMPPARPPPSSSAASSDDADIEKKNMNRSAAVPERDSDDEDAGSYVPEAVSLTHAKRTARTQEAAGAGGGGVEGAEEGRAGIPIPDAYAMSDNDEEQTPSTSLSTPSPPPPPPPPLLSPPTHRRQPQQVGSAREGPHARDSQRKARLVAERALGLKGAKG